MANIGVSQTEYDHLPNLYHHTQIDKAPVGLTIRKITRIPYYVCSTLIILAYASCFSRGTMERLILSWKWQKAPLFTYILHQLILHESFLPNCFFQLSNQESLQHSHI